MALFPSVPNWRASSTRAPQLIFEDIKIDRHLLFGKKIIPYNRGLAGSEKNKIWQQEIQKFLTQVSPHFKNRCICANYWAVVVGVSEYVLETAKRLPKWCIVIVVREQVFTSKTSENIFFLNASIQREFSKISAFYKESLLLPKDIHMVLKNLGYLWAIFHEATMIWDFHDNNQLIVNESTLLLPLNETIEAFTVSNHNSTLLNPYRFFESNSQPLWPRGYPLRSINESLTQNAFVQTLHGAWPAKNLGIINSVTEAYTLVNSVYYWVRLQLPLQFKNVSNDSNKDVKMIVPRRIFSPYDGKATLHLRSTLWALLLPVTIRQQVSDILRSYAAQRLMWDVGLQVAFVGSYAIKKDKDGYTDPRPDEHHYFKFDDLIEFLTQWSPIETNFIERVEQLFIALYGYGYIEMFDLRLAQLWLHELYHIGYIFPEIAP